MIPTTESMKTTGIPARVSATKITPSGISSWAPASSRTATSAQTAAPIATAPARARTAMRMPRMPLGASRAAPASTADR